MNSTTTGLWEVTVKEPDRAPYTLEPPFACANLEAAIEMAEGCWSTRHPLPPVVGVKLVGEVRVGRR